MVMNVPELAHPDKLDCLDTVLVVGRADNTPDIKKTTKPDLIIVHLDGNWGQPEVFGATQVPLALDYLFSEIGHALTKFADDMKLSSVDDTTGEWHAIQEDLDNSHIILDPQEPQDVLSARHT
ncbi:hypothetical protein TURU_159924 [Turdus rufiventris]|nr:hypothetical protein TURU_159924 [Turdus rufiventris]